LISFAQNYEDVMLARAFRGRESGFYIDVGAWHPVIDSVTKHFYDLGWSGINVEPAREYLALLERERPRDVNLGIALGERRERRTLHQFRGSGLSTLAEPPAEAAAFGFERREVEVDVVPLREVCEAHVRGEVDFLKIDVEGWERAVLLGGDWERFRPRIVLVEAVAPHLSALLEPDVDHGPPAPTCEAWEGLLLARDYELCYFDGLNRFYLRAEDRPLREHFRVPPNVYDQFEPWPLVEARLELDRALEELRRRG
jgi:FkbM family methyltransferase